MADTTKLAGTFEAWRGIFAVPFEHVGGLIARCLELGVPAKPCGYDYGKILVSVTIPCSSCQDLEQDFSHTHMKKFHIFLVHGAKVELICPLAV